MAIVESHRWTCISFGMCQIIHNVFSCAAVGHISDRGVEVSSWWFWYLLQGPGLDLSTCMYNNYYLSPMNTFNYVDRWVEGLTFLIVVCIIIIIVYVHHQVKLLCFVSWTNAKTALQGKIHSHNFISVRNTQWNRYIYANSVRVPLLTQWKSTKV